MSLTIFHGTMLHATEDIEHFAMKHLHADNPAKAQMPILPRQEEHISMPDEHHAIHGVAGLDCSAHGGPDPEGAQEMVYWKDLPLDNEFVSPFHHKEQRQYLTFEPDGGGWNNIRMSMETVLTMAVATGRVLVLPPSQKMYLLGSSTFSFADFFPLHEIAQEHAGLEIISMKQFLEETYGKVVKVDTQMIVTPPQNKTDWDGDTSGVKSYLNPWLQSIAMNPDWNPDACLAGELVRVYTCALVLWKSASPFSNLTQITYIFIILYPAFPESTSPEDVQTLDTLFHQLQESPPSFEDFLNQPTPVNATVKDRMAEFLSARKEICLYTTEFQQAPILHFHGKKNLGGRLLVHFYAFLFFQDYQQDLWMKRFVRDHIRYVDDVQCAAARIVQAVRQHSKDKGNGGVYDAFHIRRGDFQYKKTRVDADEILRVAKDQIPKGTTVYVGTDERHKDFFQVMSDYWDVVFLNDVLHLVEGVDKNYYGMIDQLVTSRGRTFFGCWFSTFTGYITRLRGYHSQIEETQGYEMGLLPNTYYYTLEAHKTKMHDFWPIKKLFYAREYPASWRNLDFDVE
jgi:hypothetical protein